MTIQKDIDDNFGNMLTNMSGQISPEGGDPEHIETADKNNVNELDDMLNIED